MNDTIHESIIKMNNKYLKFRKQWNTVLIDFFGEDGEFYFNGAYCISLDEFKKVIDDLKLGE